MVVYLHGDEEVLELDWCHNLKFFSLLKVSEGVGFWAAVPRVFNGFVLHVVIGGNKSNKWILH